MDSLNVRELLSDPWKQKKLVEIHQTSLTAPGDNYASLMLALKLTFENEEDLQLVAKLLPPNEFMKTFMNSSITFRNELAFYQTILPTLREHTGKKLDFFPKFYGGRLDHDAILLLENLKTEGYGLLDHRHGLDLETTQVILSQMADLHSSVIALRENKPRVFEEKLKPFFEPFKIFQLGEDGDFMASSVIVEMVTKIVKEDQFCALHLSKIEETIKISIANLKLPKNSAKFQQDLFATLIHDDLWVNNLMVKTKTDIKLIDWQLYYYASATKDILFFLCASVQLAVLEENFDNLILFYFQSLSKYLEELDCSKDKFSFGAFQEEIKRAASQVSYFYIMICIPSIFATEDQVGEVTEVSKEMFFEQMRKVSDDLKRRICFITRKFIQNGWI